MTSRVRFYLGLLDVTLLMAIVAMTAMIGMLTDRAWMMVVSLMVLAHLKLIVDIRFLAPTYRTHSLRYPDQLRAALKTAHCYRRCWRWARQHRRHASSQQRCR